MSGFRFQPQPPAEIPIGYEHIEEIFQTSNRSSLPWKKRNPLMFYTQELSRTPDCRDYPIRGLDVNVLGTAYLFKSCLKMDLSLERFVFASSTAVNGPQSSIVKMGIKSRRPPSTL